MSTRRTTDGTGGSGDSEPLHITGALWELLNDLAVAAGPLERMGVLASPAQSAAVTDLYLLPAAASGSHAEAAPAAIKRCADAIAAGGLIPRALFHTHGLHGAFLSAVDHATAERLLPAMAGWNWQRPHAPATLPSVAGPDAALLPLPDGRALSFRLSGRPLPGVEAHEVAQWTAIQTGFGTGFGRTGQTDQEEPCACLEGAALRLQGGGVTITLQLPPGALLTCQTVDHAPVRTARLYSLVVTGRGEAAECVVVQEVAGQPTTIRRLPCRVELTSGPGRAAAFEARQDSSRGAVQAAAAADGPGAPLGLLARLWG